MQQFNKLIITLGVHIVINKLVMATTPKTFCFDLPKDAANNLNHKIYSIIKHNEQTIKNQVRQLFSNYKHLHDIHEQGK